MPDQTVEPVSSTEFCEHTFKTKFKSKWWMSSGVVAKRLNMEKGKGVELFVYCPEILPLHKVTTVEPEPEEVIVNVKGTKELPQSSCRVKLGACIKAHFMGWNDSHISVPDMVPNERVLLFRYSGDDIIYWIPFQKDSHLRTVEQYRIACQNKEHGDEPSEDELWYIEVDSRHDRWVRIKTGQGKGERYGYTFEIEPDKHHFKFYDTDGNFIELNSEEKRIELHNQQDTMVKLIDKDIEVYAPQDLKIHVGRNLTLQVEGDTAIDIGGKLDTKVAGNVTTEILGAETRDIAGNLSITADGFNVTSSNAASITTNSGNISLTAAGQILLSPPWIHGH